MADARDFRDVLSELLDTELTEDAWRLIIEKALAVEKKVWVDFNCKACGKAQRQQAVIPDALGVMKALEVAANQAKGTPKQTVRHEHSGVVGLRAVSEMSAAEIESELAVVRARRVLPPGPPEAA